MDKKLIEKLITEAKEIAERNFCCGHSGFTVGAALLTADGKIYKGFNIENDGIQSICAERVAITSAVASGYKKGDFSKLYVMCDSPKISSSCFICRQMINEFFDKEAEIVFYSNDGEKETYLVKDLCPYPFGSSDLK